jgi:nucleotide-binding universal stress UspA family protein
MSATASVSRVLCGVDGSDTDAEAVRQAALLAGPDGQLEIVSVAKAPESGATALERAKAVAAEVGTSSSTRVIEGDDVWDGLAEATADHDLLVLGDDLHHGSASSHALRHSPIPVLIARSGAVDFPNGIMLATNGDEPSTQATALTAAIAKAHASAVTMVTIDHVELRERRHALIEEAAELFRTLGVEPQIVKRTGDADEEIVAAARQLEPSLLVLGSGGKRGLRALGSVSEKVAHSAPCSVLVARHE